MQLNFPLIMRSLLKRLGIESHLQQPCMRPDPFLLLWSCCSIFVEIFVFPWVCGLAVSDVASQDNLFWLLDEAL